jgi:glycosyltransferase involved in cell wall biosynthesis
LVLGKGKHYCALEDEVCHRAHSIIIVKEYYKESIPKKDHHKITVIKNGYNIPHDLELENPYNKELNAVYVGLTPLDPATLKALCETYHKLSIHIFGSCLRGKRNIKNLTSLSNFHYHGFSPPSEYLAYLKYADLAIFPFKSWGAMKHVGFTSKFFNYMYFSLPIITYKTGDPSEFTPFNIIIAEKKEDFIREVGYITDNPKK